MLCIRHSLPASLPKHQTKSELCFCTYKTVSRGKRKFEAEFDSSSRIWGLEGHRKKKRGFRSSSSSIVILSQLQFASALPNYIYNSSPRAQVSIGDIRRRGKTHFHPLALCQCNLVLFATHGCGASPTSRNPTFSHSQRLFDHGWGFGNDSFLSYLLFILCMGLSVVVGD